MAVKGDNTNTSGSARKVSDRTPHTCKCCGTIGGCKKGAC